MPPDFTSASSYFDSWNIGMFDKTYVRGLNKDKVIAGCFWHVGEYAHRAGHFDEKPSTIKSVITEVLKMSKMILFPDHFQSIL